ncbi:MAG: type 3 dihydrofolate reductase [Bacteroidia bacterium]|nr:type 3 dihydrofolate reductase [Bacteroidia bacterium]
MISAIVATARNNVIGKDNDIPWYLPADLKYFKKQTLDHHILMGRKCFESIGRPLPKRTNIVISRNPFFLASNCLVAHSVREGIDLAIANDEEELFIIGGGQIYELTEPLWDRLYLTHVDLYVEGDVLFPDLDMDEWELISETHHKKDEKNEHDYTFKIFERIKSQQK